MKTGFTYDVQALQKLLGSIIQRHVSPDTWNWMNERKTTAIGSSAFNTVFAAMPRKTGKALVQIKDEEKNQLQSLRPGLTINNWSIDRFARVWLLLHIDPSDEEKYFQSIDHLFLAAEMNELVALYSALPLLSYPERWRQRCADGIRSNIGDVLQAIMCNNPYPSEQLDEKAWNQLVLKAFFTERAVDEIIGLDERANQELANILSDYAHERWAAHREVNPLLWRCVAPFVDEEIFSDIERIASSNNIREQQAAALVIEQNNFSQLVSLLQSHPNLKQFMGGQINWDTIANEAGTL